MFVNFELLKPLLYVFVREQRVKPQDLCPRQVFAEWLAAVVTVSDKEGNRGHNGTGEAITRLSSAALVIKLYTYFIGYKLCCTPYNG